ncbi:prostaglandin D2 receptor 2-like [Oryzias latipes]|uniref:prostaglandin D2 receptor 2-like n=1 Tax=Oryzias latipes TaxID=8090 RepID=UPI0002A47C48|nr:prostaglandin D2 receptor 2-like [Oryzias latipes]
MDKGEPLLCPLLQKMTVHGLNNNTKANLVVVGVHGLVSLLGILENALIIWVLGFRLSSRTVTSVWVLNLALTDFLATLMLPLFTAYLHSSHSWELGDALCKVQASIFFFNMFVSAFLLAAISLDRLLLVFKPIWSLKHRSVAGAWKVSALGWLWGAINTAPYFVFRSVVEKMDGRKLCYYNFALYLPSNGTLQRDCDVRHGTTAISKMLLAFLIPLMVITGSHIKIALTLNARNKWRKRSAIVQSDKRNTLSTNEASKREFGNASTKRNSIMLGPIFTKSRKKSLYPSSFRANGQNKLSPSFKKMVAAVVLVFALCWAPYQIFCMIELTAQDNEETLKLVETWLPLAATLAFLNPVLNPILYAFSCPNFFVRIRQNLGAVFDELVAEKDGESNVPINTIRAQMRQGSNRDVTVTTPGSPKSSSSLRQSSHS